MKQRFFSQLTHPRRTSVPYLVLLGSLLLTAIAAHYVTITAKTKDRLQFENAVTDTLRDIQEHISISIGLLQAGSGLFAASDEVSREEFRAFVSRLRISEQHPGIQGIGFSRQVPASQKDALTAAMRQQGIADFAIFPETPRSIYHTIVYLEPLDQRNRAAIGYDMFTEPTRRAAMRRARDTGNPAASGHVTLVQEIDQNKQAGFLIYLPIYQTPTTPSSIAERRATLRGFIYTPFRTDDLMRGIFGDNINPYVDLRIYDGTAINPAHLLHDSALTTAPPSSHRPLFSSIRMIDVAGRPWTITFTARPELDRESERRLVPLIYLGGGLVSLILFGVTRSQVKARIAAERAATHLRQSEQALRESEARFQAFMNHSPTAGWIINRAGELLYLNNTYYRIFNLPDDALGKPISQVFAPEFAEVFLEHNRIVIDENRVLEVIEQTPRANGSIGEFLVYKFPISDSTGNRLMGGIAIDITESRQAEELLRRSEIRFRTLMEQSPIGTQILSPEGRVLRVNRAWEELWGVTLKELEHYNIFTDPQLIDNGTMPYIQRGFAGEAITIPPVLYAPQQRSHATQPQRWIQAYIYPVKDLAGYMREVVLMQEDITARKQLEEQLRTRAEQLTEANRLKDEFLATLSHELRTPLNAIMGWAQMLATRQLDDSTYHRATETIYRNSRTLTQLIEDLLDVSRIITGKLQFNVYPISLIPVIEAAIATIQPAAETKHIHLHTSLNPTVGLVLADANRLQQIIWNLLSNAIKFTPELGRVDITLTQVNTHAQLQVKDTGQGISLDFLPYVFERFRQADGSMTRTQGGLGLGLAIVHHLVELHGGTVEAESAGIGKGTTFTVTLPLVAAHEADTTHLQPSSLHLSTETDNGSLQGCCILVVDDEADARELVAMTLTQQGANIISAASVAEAWQMFHQMQPHLLISDIGLPGETGYDLLQRIRALETDQGGDIPAIALTAFARAEDQEKALGVGFQIHLSKPFDPHHLVVLVEQLVKR